MRNIIKDCYYIKGVIDTCENPADKEELLDKFVEWVKANVWSYYGTIQPATLGVDEVESPMLPKFVDTITSNKVDYGRENEG